MSWYEKWFNEDYAQLYAHRNHTEAIEIIEFIEHKIGALSGKNVLDMCCGLGRLSFELAPKCMRVHGFDLSPYFISECLKNNRFQHVSFSRQDMRQMAFEKPFDIIFHMFTSFGYFETLEENLAVFRNVHQALHTNGYYYFDFLNSDWVRKTLISEDQSEIDGYLIKQSRKIEANRVIKDISIRNDQETREYQESVMLISKETFDHQFTTLGFDICGVYGTYSGENFNPESSKRLIYLLRKK